MTVKLKELTSENSPLLLLWTAYGGELRIVSDYEESKGKRVDAAQLKSTIEDVLGIELTQDYLKELGNIMSERITLVKID